MHEIMLCVLLLKLHMVGFVGTVKKHIAAAPLFECTIYFQLFINAIR